MSSEARNIRIRRLISRLNMERKKQAHKLDILCNDIIKAQRLFIRNIESISFSADLYERILGVTDPDELFDICGNMLQQEVPDSKIVFFLRQMDGHEVNIPCDSSTEKVKDFRLEEAINKELVEEICSANKICNLNDLFAMGLIISPAFSSSISAVTIPLCHAGYCLGFILIYAPAESALSADNVYRIAKAGVGLSRAIESLVPVVEQFK